MGVMVMVGTDNRGRDAKTKTNNKNRRYFGLILADIDHQTKRVELRYSPRGKQPLGDGHREKCMIWALDALADLKDRGYVFTVPEAVPSG